MMLSSQQQEAIQAINGFDWVKSAVATVVFFLRQMPPDQAVLRKWGITFLRVRHIIAALESVFGQFNVIDQ